MKLPQIWHYGLVARFWGELETEAGPELKYYKKCIETSGQPALDLGCGSGRLLENVATRQIRARLWMKDKLLKEEIHTQRLDDYSKNELVLMLEKAGFSDIRIYGDFTDGLATADHNDLIFISEK